MIFESILIAVGLVCVVVGHTTGRLQLRALGAGAIACGVVVLLLTAVFG